MPDTLTKVVGGSTDTKLKLYRAAVERAKTIHSLGTDEGVWTRMGWSRSTFYRLLAGTHDPRLSEAVAFAAWIDWPLDSTFGQAHR